MCANFECTLKAAVGLVNSDLVLAIGRSSSHRAASSIASTGRMCTWHMSCVPSVYFVAVRFRRRNPKPDYSRKRLPVNSGRLRLLSWAFGLLVVVELS